MNTARPPKLVAFTIVELMAATVIVSVLVALALPRFRLFIATARQAEAHANLGIIASLQQSYHLEYSEYHEGLNMGGGQASAKCGQTSIAELKNTLGFRSTNCNKLRYTYESKRSSSANDTAKNDGTTPSERLIYPNCTGKKDQWVIGKGRDLEHHATENVIKQCHQ